MKINYQRYIQSTEWYRKHKHWLLESNYRCSMFPWIQCGSGKHYRIHHKTYDNIGNEVLWKDVIVLSPFAHDFIIHGVLSGFKSAGKQKRKYPNRYQKIAHHWCCLPMVCKLLVIAVISFVATYFAASSTNTQ